MLALARSPSADPEILDVRMEAVYLRAYVGHRCQCDALRVDTLEGGTDGA